MPILTAEKFEELMFVFMRHMSSSLCDCAITHTQIYVLNYLSKNDKCRMSDLGKHLGVTLGNVTGVVDRLLREGRVRRVSDPRDRRVVRVELTGKGKNLIENISKIKRESFGKFLGKLSNDDNKALLRSMQKVANSLEEERGRI